MTALFEDVIFGPILSRRLGVSLGVNLLPQKAKICNFDCIYCECGDNDLRRGEAQSRHFADSCEVGERLEAKLKEMKEEGSLPDVITFSGNGEPTLHPDFEQIINQSIELRDRYAPSARISVLSNATTLSRESVINALMRVDNSILKLDSAFDQTAHIINRPTSSSYTTKEIIAQLSSIGSRAIVQSMFLRGEVDGVAFDNTTDREVEAWLAALDTIRPRQVMIYSLDRDTPCKGLIKISREELLSIGAKVEALGLECSIA